MANNSFFKVSADAPTYVIVPLLPPDVASTTHQARALSGRQFIELFEKNYARIRRNEAGLTMEDIAIALGKPAEFALTEYVMLEETLKYFHTIFSLAPAEYFRRAPVITFTHKEVLKQFLLHSDFSLPQFDSWLQPKTELTPPPLMTSSSAK